MEGLISLEFLSEQVGAVLKAWAIVMPLLMLLLLVAWKTRGIWREGLGMARHKFIEWKFAAKLSRAFFAFTQVENRKSCRFALPTISFL